MQTVSRAVLQVFDPDTNRGRAAQFCLILLCSTVALTIAALQCYANRDHVFQDDVVTYLDLSDAVLRGDWHELANAHFCPLYPIVLAAFRLVTHSNQYWEPAVVKSTNFVMFLLVLVAFNCFLSAFLRDIRARCDTARVKISPLLLILALYAWFWWTSLAMGAVYMDTPDYFVTAAMLTASTIMMGLRANPSRRELYVLLGAVLGLGYLAKAIMAPISMVYLLMIPVRGLGLRQNAANFFLAAACFSFFMVPQVTAISLKTGYFTLSESGRYNYALFVDHSCGEYFPEGPGFTHAPRVIWDHPKIYEFATPIGGTYPLWYDPIYWRQGLANKFSTNLFVLIGKNAYVYAAWFGCPLLLAMLVQNVMSFRFIRLLRGVTTTWRLWLPPIVGLALYMPIIPIGTYGSIEI